MTDKEIVQTVVDRLNLLLGEDPAAVLALVNNRVPCRAELQQNGFQVFASTEGPRLGLIGVLNGLLGFLDEGKAVIAVHGEVDARNQFTEIVHFANLLPESEV